MNINDVETALKRMVRGRNGVKLRYRVYADAYDTYENTDDVYVGVEIPDHISWGAFFYSDASAEDIAVTLARKYREHLDWYVGDMCSRVLYQITDARCSRIINIKDWNRLTPWEDIVAIAALKDDNGEAEYRACRKAAVELGYTEVADALYRAHTTITERED